MALQIAGVTIALLIAGFLFVVHYRALAVDDFEQELRAYAGRDFAPYPRHAQPSWFWGVSLGRARHRYKARLVRSDRSSADHGVRSDLQESS